MKGFTLEGEDYVESGLGLYKSGAILDENLCKEYLYEINDKSKANILTKAIAMTQITRFLLEEINRACNGLPISPLEYFTCAQVFAALFMYVYWLEKPHGVQERIHVRVLKGHKRYINDEDFDLESTLTAFTVSKPENTDIEPFPCQSLRSS